MATPKTIIDLAEPEIFYPFLPDRRERFWEGLRNAPASLESDYLAKWRRHRLTPLLYHEVVAHGWQGFFSPWLLSELKIDYAGALRAASRQEAELLNVLGHFKRQGMEVTLLKGADLRHRLYGDPASRPMMDADFLISAQMVSRAQQVLSDLGYRLARPFTDDSVRMKLKFSNELCFYPPPGKRLPLDLHWEIEAVARLYRISYDALSCQSTEYDGIKVKVLIPEHLLIHLCLHILNHPRYGPDDLAMGLQIIDLAWAVDRLPLDWSRFLEDAVRWRCGLAVYYALRGLAVLLPDAVPARVMSALAKSRSSWYEEPVLWLWYGLGNLYHKFPGLEDYLPRFTPLRKMWLK